MNRRPRHLQDSDSYSCSSSDGDGESEYQESFDISENIQDLFDALYEDQMHVSEETIQKARQNDRDALFQLGAAYFDLANPVHHTKGVEWYRMAADLNHPEAQYELAESYFQGDGIAKDFQHALHYYRTAAFNQYAKAYFKVAACYMRGWGCTCNEKEGYKWLIKAAQHGDAKAFLQLGQMAEKRVYDPVQRRAAIEYYFMSYTRGMQVALDRLNVLMKDKVYTFSIEREEDDWSRTPCTLSPTEIMDRLLDPTYETPRPPTPPPPPPEENAVDQVIKHHLKLVFGRKFGYGGYEYNPYLKDKKFGY